MAPAWTGTAWTTNSRPGQRPRCCSTHGGCARRPTTCAHDGGRLRRGLLLALALTTAVALVVPVSGASAQDGRIALADGAWRGTMGAAGVLSGSQEGAQVVWTGSLSGSNWFTAASGNLDGSWDWTGTADMLVSTPEGNVPISLQTVGGGPLTGSADRLQLTGQETTTGSGSFMGITTPIGPNTHSLDPIDVRLTDVGCYSVFGDWTTGLNDIIEREGLSGSLTGWFVATPMGATMPGEEIIDDLESRYAELEERVLVAIAGSGEVITGPGLFEVFEILEEATLLQAQAADLDETCAYEVEGGPFTNPLTSLLTGTLLLMVETMNGTQLFNAAQMLVAAGGAGGAASDAFASQLVDAIAEQAQYLHDQYVSTEGNHRDLRPCSIMDPCVLVRDEVLNLHLAASFLGFELNVHGMPVDITILGGAP